MNIVEFIIVVLSLFKLSMSTLSMRRVAVVGGGPAGLVASRQLLEAGIRPKLFTKTIGGMWNKQTNPFWPSMKTNLSKYTCQFSDQSWEKDAPMFPSQSDLNNYLNTYAEKTLRHADVILNCHVTGVYMESNGEFKLTWQDNASDASNCETFDDVIVTTGFFSKPIMKPLKGFSGRMIHSSEYKNPDEFAGRNVVVAGSSFSSSEIAADVARVAASVRNVVPRPSWMLPRYLPLSTDKPNTPFLPLDLLFYQLNPKKDTMEARKEALIKHDADRVKSGAYMDCLQGSTTNDVMRQIREEEKARHIAAAEQNGYSVPSVHSSISDNFATMVKAGYVSVVQGYVHSGRDNAILVAPTRDSLTPSPPTTAATAAGIETVLDNVDDLILCTGFNPALDFLSPTLREQLDYTPEDTLQPLLLHREVMHPRIPGLYFVGMYRGPYFAGVELQARAVAAYVSGKLPMPSEEAMSTGLQAARQIRAQQPRPQFPHADYIGMCIDWMRDLGLPLRPQPSCSNVFTPGMLTSHSAPTAGINADISPDSAVSDLAQAFADCLRGKYLSQSIFRALQGDWEFQRTLISHLESSPSGTVVGKISLARHSRQSSDLVYTERGQFTTEKGMKMDVNGSQYVYALNEAEDSIEIFFADKETGREKERIFVSLKVTERSEQGWVAVGEPHLCGQDTYVVKFLFAFQGLALRSVDIQIDVKGPFKDYRSSTTLLPVQV